MICIAALNQIELVPVIEKIRSAKPYYRPNSTMLRVADQILQPRQRLVEFAGSFKAENAFEDVGLAAIPLAGI
jgi:predicted protein tyrosine phosphatase